RIIFIIAMLYCDAATFCRRRNDAGIMTDETGRRCAQESIDIIIMKNKYYYLFIKNNFDYLLINEYMIKKSVDCFYILIFLLPLHWNGQNEGLSLVYSFLLGYKQ
ncbi:MAG: hypothetical protein SPH22_03115, partial [Prevotella sp.]|nr:hypothetical protein [Prevotella sp.]MDY5288628.1 hypothetical protein [Prevotella sp.]